MTSISLWALVILSVLVILLTDDGDSSKTELPTTCRECDENERTYNTFRCPECHSEMTPDDHPPLATEWEGDDGE